MSAYFTAEGKERLAYLMGRTSALAEACKLAADNPEDLTTITQQLTEALQADLDELRDKLFPPEVLDPRD